MKKEDKTKIAEILEINEGKVDFIANEKIEYFRIQGNKDEKIHIKTEINFKELLKIYPLVFENCTFKSFKCIADKKESIKKLGFIECEIDFFSIKNIEFTYSFEMSDCKIGLDYEIGNKQNTECKFLFAIFKGDCNFFNTIFNANCHFFGSNFQGKCYFRNAKFYKDCNFSGSQFKEDCDFSRADFKDNVSFYAAIFEKGFDFSQTNFEKNLNLVNTDLNFDFKVLKEKIKGKKKIKIEEKSENNKKQGIDKTLEQLANDFRDGFRICKNALIKDNNLLDASNFHKLELYAKEIELEEKSKRKIEWDKSKLEENINKNAKKFKYKIECLLLTFYRKSSDHHTDFLKIFNNFILLISLYVVFLLGIFGIYQDKLHLTGSSFFNNFEFLIKMHKDKMQDNAIYSILFDLFNFFYSYKFLILIISFLLILGICKFIKKFRKDFWELIKSIVLACLFDVFFVILFNMISDSLFKFLDLDLDLFSLFINVSFVILYLVFVCTQSSFLRYLCLVFSYLCFICILIQAPSIINIISHFSSDSNFNNPNYPALMTLNTIYIILSLLILFSVQKTARKNSIVPT